MPLRRPLPRSLAALAVLAALAASGGAVGAADGPDLSGTVPILAERFEAGLDRYDGRRGLWTTLPRRGVLMTNAAEAVFLDRGVLPPAADAALPPLHAVTPEGLSLRSARLPPAAQAAVRDRMRATGQGGRAEAVRFATAMVSTADTWAQTYGYFEIRARIPRGKGRWPAFWLTFAGRGWPPEIDVFEAYGAGLDRPTPKDGSFNTAVIFDAWNEAGERVHATDLANPHDPDGPAAAAKPRGGRTVHTFGQVHRGADLGADIYGAPHVYAALWGPEEVVFYFGPDRARLREIYRAPTPDDLHVPMYLIANDQFTARGGWWSPREAALDRVLDPANDLLVESIEIRALRPPLAIDMAAGGDPSDPRSSTVRDTPGDDLVAPGAGFDLIELSGGADVLRLERGREGKVVSGFGPDDRLRLEGFPFRDAADAHARLTQVGDDVWLPAGADPFWPQTIVLRGLRVDEVAPSQIEIR